MALVAMVGLEPGSSVFSNGVHVANVVYKVSLMIRPTSAYFLPDRVIGRVAALKYNAWIFHARTRSPNLRWLWVGSL